MREPSPDEIRVRHMLHAAEELKSFIHGKTKVEFAQNRMLALAVLKDLEIIGEAANAVSDSYRAKHKEIPWPLLVGMRNRLIHGYFEINLEIVWNTVQNDMPALTAKLRSLVP